VSALGQKRTLAVQQGVSALPPRADIAVRTSHLTRHYLGQSGQVHIDARNADLYIRKVSFGSVIDADIVPDTERQTTVAVENPAHFSQLADITPDGWDRASPLAQPEMFWPCRLDRNSTAQAIVP
jgi:hypothetical protein